MTVALIVAAVLVGWYLIVVLPDWVLGVLVIGWVAFGFVWMVATSGEPATHTNTPGAYGAGGAGESEDCGDWRFDSYDC